ncbi:MULTISPECIES: hypothetical protein [Streptomyces]|uniref:hypothetical protein n=1 Tax=Streptomyces TaxID=1883 RepID=UPI000CD54E73|nr:MULTISPECIES: hypothetical protein [Streptomyces]
MTALRARSLHLPAAQIRIGDFLSVGGRTVTVTFAEHRGGVVRLELDAASRLTLQPAATLTVTRPRPSTGLQVH